MVYPKEIILVVLIRMKSAVQCDDKNEIMGIPTDLLHSSVVHLLKHL